MIRLNLVLLLGVLLSALYLVNVQYESRRLFAEINMAEVEARKLASEYERLQVEKRAQATPGRVEKLAREQLRMRGASPAITHYVNYVAPQSALVSAPVLVEAPVKSQEVKGRVQ